MKTTKNISLTLTCLGTALILAGCATSSGYKKADKTGKGINEFRDEVVNLKQAVDGAMASLTKITESAATDPRKSYQDFAKSVDKVETALAKAEKRAADMKATGEAYFKQWEEQIADINNPDIRKLSEDREAKLNELFGKLPPAVEQAKTDFGPFLSDLKDLRTFLSQDLTVGGVNAAKGIITKTRDHGVALQRSLDNLIAETDAVATALTPSKLTTEEK